MIIYEVNLEVETEIEDAFRDWLPEHISHILKFAGFRSAKWWQRNAQDESESPQEQDKVLWTIHYSIDDRESLNQYFEQHAPKMRQEALDRFGKKFAAKRRILALLESFS